MKASLLTFALLSLLATSGLARTWTSSDGSKTFEGELRSFDAETGLVKVLIGGRVVEFAKDKLSQEDITFLEESATAKGTAAAGPDESTEIGAKVAKAKLQQLDGKRYRRAEASKPAEYYILYYSASW